MDPLCDVRRFFVQRALLVGFGAPRGGGGGVVVVVGGHGWSILPQIGRWGARGRLVVAMGHTSACGVVVVSVWGPTWTMVGAGSQGKAPHWVVVGGEKWSELPQIGRWWVQGRLVVGMGHTS